MDRETERKQWLLCHICGRDRVLKPGTIEKIMSHGSTREEAEEYVKGTNTYLWCPQEHVNPVMVPISALEHGAYYCGKCRNAQVARWDAVKQQFTYMREKFGHVYPEAIRYWVEGHHFDEFRPYSKLDNPPFEITVK